jgi:hypothetical protein
MLSDKIQAARKHRFNSMNDIAVLGKYDFFTTIVWLDAIETQNIRDITEHRLEVKAVLENHCSDGISFELYNKISKLLPLASHEYTHYIDCTSTLWGVKLLVLMDEAYSGLKAPVPGDEVKFFKAKLLSDFVKQIKLPMYYTEIGSSQALPRRWHYKVSIGKKFNSSGFISDDPIVFVRFTDSENVLIARSPISTLSILECSSTSQEIEQRIALIESINDDSAKIIERSQYENQLVEETYNKNLTEYSVCAHLLANVIREPDISFVYSRAGILCRIILNFPDKLFDKLVGEEIVNTLNFEGAEEWCSRLNKGLENRDLGVLYYLFCEVIRLKAIDLSREPNQWINELLNALRIDISDIKELAEEQFSECEFNITTIKQIYDAGIKNFKKIDWLQSQINLNELILPPAYLGDMEYLNFFYTDIIHSVQSQNLDDLFNELHSYEKNVHKFVDACI